MTIQMKKRKVLTFVLAVICVMVLVAPVQAAELKDGTYSIQFEALQDDGSTSRMGDSIQSPIRLKVEGGKIIAELSLKNTSSDLTINGSDATLISEGSEYSTYQFPVSSVDAKLAASVYVSAMGSNPSFNIILQGDTLELVEAADTEDDTNNDDEKAVSDDKKDAEKSTEDNNDKIEDTSAKTTAEKNPKTSDIQGVEAAAALLLASGVLVIGIRKRVKAQ